MKPIRGITALAVILGVCVAAVLVFLAIPGPQPGKDGMDSWKEANEYAMRHAGKDLSGHALYTVPRPLPPLRFLDSEERETGLEAFRGRVVLFNFWATWCGPCVRELPSLLRLGKSFGEEDFALIALSEDRNGPQEVVPFLKKHGLAALPVFYDVDMAVSREIRVPHMPTTLLIDRQGRLAGRFEGAFDWNAPAAMKLVGELVDSGTQAAR